jgi:ribokinase
LKPPNARWKLPRLPALDDSLYRLCDFVTPNESEASMLTGVAVNDAKSAKQAAKIFVKKGVGTALVTMGEQGAYLHSAKQSVHIPAYKVGKVAETTGAGDAFNGGFAAALARGLDSVKAAHFGAATAGISVTRSGTAPSMPTRAEVEALLAKS